MEKIGILFSGGLESTSLIVNYEKNYKIKLIYIKYGYEWEEAELKFAKKIANFFKKDLIILNYSLNNLKQLGIVKSKKDNIILMRNLNLIVNGANYLVNNGIYNLTIGLFGDKDYPDTSKEYLKNLQNLISLGINKKFNILLPFYGLNKKIIFEKFKEKIPLNLIFSCANPINSQRCHNCYKCKQLDKLIKG